MRTARFLVALGTALPVAQAVAQPVAEVTIHERPAQWSPVTLDLRHILADESGDENPFLDYRMSVTFTHADSGRSIEVPGYFAADGNAAESGATMGSTWRAHLLPDRPCRLAS